MSRRTSPLILLERLTESKRSRKRSDSVPRPRSPLQNPSGTGDKKSNKNSPHNFQDLTLDLQVSEVGLAQQITGLLEVASAVKPVMKEKVAATVLSLQTVSGLVPGSGLAERRLDLASVVTPSGGKFPAAVEARADTGRPPLLVFLVEGTAMFPCTGRTVVSG